MKTIDFYSIRAISNLHVGSGEGDFSVVDKMVQRDPITNLPTIHGSGIKGAMREAMEYQVELKNKAEGKETENPDPGILSIFGADPKRKGGKTQQGQNNFFDAKLLALPVRSSQHFYYLATCPSILNNLVEDLEIFDYNWAGLSTIKSLAQINVQKGIPVYFGVKQNQLRLEDWGKTEHNNTAISSIINQVGNRLALLHDDDMSALSTALPVIARNYLVSGISENLWYEEVVPRESRFYFSISRHEDNDGVNTFLGEKNNLLQIGANATVGYGLCQIQKM